MSCSRCTPVPATASTRCSATAAIVDDENAVSVAVTAQTAAEPTIKSGFRFIRSGRTTTALTVAYDLTGTAINGTDYDALPGTITIPAGQTEAALILKPKDDTLAEGPETVRLTLRTPLDGSYLPLGQTSVLITIIDNEPTPPILAIAAQGTPAEPATNAAFVITRSCGSAAIAIPLTVIGTATPGSDYNALPSSVSLAAGATTAVISVTVRNDTLAEGPEQIQVTLGSSPSYLITTASAVLTLIDDERPRLPH